MNREWLRESAFSGARWLARDFSPKRRATPQDRSLLLLARHLPPTVNAGVFRPLSWLRYAAQNGWEVSALAGGRPARPTEAGQYLLDSLPAQVRIEHIKDRRLVSKRMPTLNGGMLNAFRVYGVAMDRFRERPPQVVVATGPRFYMFVAAYGIAKHLGARLVLDYRDEWTLSPFAFARPVGILDRIWERRCLCAADRVLFTTQSQLENQLESFRRLDRSKCHVVPNGWDPSDHHASESGPNPQEGRFILGYYGTLTDHNFCESFLGSCESLLSRRPDWRDRLRIRFIGRKNPLVAERLDQFPFSENLESLDVLPQPEANALLRESDALLLMSPRDLARYLPGKTYEYLASDRPVLTYGHPGEVWRLVERIHAGPTVESGDSVALERSLDRIASSGGAEFDRPDRREFAAAHTRENLARRFFQILEELDV